MCMFPVGTACKKSDLSDSGVWFYAPSSFFLKYQAWLYLKMPVSLKTQKVFGPGRQEGLDFFTETSCGVQN